MIEAWLTQEATITPRNVEVTDELGNVVLTAGAPTSTIGLAQQAGESDRRDDQDLSVGDWWVFLPAGTAVAATSKIEIGGLTLEVVGRPRQPINALTGHVSHIEARCRLVEG